MTPDNTKDVLNGDWSDSNAPLDGCHLCQRFQPLLWHCTSKTIQDRALCRRGAGNGVWVCSLCEEALHQWMRKNPDEMASQHAVTALLDRLAERLLAPRRKYRKQGGTQSD